jgi:hypothetical protein
VAAARPSAPTTLCPTSEWRPAEVDDLCREGNRQFKTKPGKQRKRPEAKRLLSCSILAPLVSAILPPKESRGAKLGCFDATIPRTSYLTAADPTADHTERFRT